MTRDSYLNPTYVAECCKEIINNLQKDNENIDLAGEALEGFLTDETITSDAFGSLKQQLLDYQLILLSMKNANDLDIQDARALIDGVGTQELDGENILDNKERCYEDYLTYSDFASEYSNAASNVSAIDAELAYEYQSTADTYRRLADNAYASYEYYCSLEELYDEIEASTSNLFSNSGELRANITLGLIAVGKAFDGGEYIAYAGAPWRESLMDMAYDDETVEANYEKLALDVVGKFGIVGGTASAWGKMAYSGVSAKTIIGIGKNWASKFGKLAKQAYRSDYKKGDLGKTLFGVSAIDKDLIGSSGISAGWKSCCKSVKKEISDFNFGEAENVGSKISVAAKWAGTIATFATSAIDNVDEYNEKKGTAEEISKARAGAETIIESLVTIGETTALTAAVTGVAVAAGLGGAPVVLVGGAVVIASWGIDYGVEKYTSTHGDKEKP